MSLRRVGSNFYAKHHCIDPPLACAASLRATPLGLWRTQRDISVLDCGRAYSVKYGICILRARLWSSMSLGIAMVFWRTFKYGDGFQLVHVTRRCRTRFICLGRGKSNGSALNGFRSKAYVAPFNAHRATRPVSIANRRSASSFLCREKQAQDSLKRWLNLILLTSAAMHRKGFQTTAKAFRRGTN